MLLSSRFFSAQGAQIFIDLPDAHEPGRPQQYSCLAVHTPGPPGKIFILSASPELCHPEHVLLLRHILSQEPHNYIGVVHHTCINLDVVLADMGDVKRPLR